jgi:glycosyltransferase involved in cell wall biosynthesis
MAQHIDISVIVPVYNGENCIGRCLDALAESSYTSYEIIVVDDCSTDDTVNRAQRKWVTVLQLEEQSGPAVARNCGANHARGEILLFVDADVIVRNDTIAKVAEDFQNHPRIAALFGSYDDDPVAGNFLSQYRNLFHHFIHQTASTEAFTFWAGCGAIYKKVFDEIGGFDYNLFKIPSIEDIELGYRLRKRGNHILLDKDLQVKHIKRWDFLSMLKTDIFQRAIPWSRLILETNVMSKDLNLKLSHQLSTLSVGLLVVLFPSLFLFDTQIYGLTVAHVSGILFFIVFIFFLILNRNLYTFFARKKGVAFAIMVLPHQLLYYLYSGLSFGYCWLTHKTSKLKFAHN